MENDDLLKSAFDRESYYPREIVDVHPEIDMEHGVTGRYRVSLSNPDSTFIIEIAENGHWRSVNAPVDIDPDFITWVGNEIEQYYR